MNPYRLPRTVIPLKYDIRLDPDLKSASFSGAETITLDVKESVSEITLNSLELFVDAGWIETSDGKETASISLEPEKERCTLKFENKIPLGRAKLDLKFRGTLNDKLRGFYRSTVRTPTGDRLLAATQFEATDARRAFPCWDEPDFKAVFCSTLGIDPALTAISNTAIKENRVENGKRIIRFGDTIPMSTYLVAYVVGEFEATDPVLVGKTPLRVWCVPGKKRLAKVGQDIGVFSLKFFEEFYGRAYPGDKLDLIAIPDFAAGAMENLGAITFRETALLVDPSVTTHNEMERVADVVAHENAHMWFGDLVTMSWWNGLWLNEAFATFMEMLAVDAWKPEWHRWTTFGVSKSVALVVDGLKSTRPIEFPVQAPRDADAMFDVLTYDKGASVLRMIEQFMGPKVFQEGVRIYLARHAFKNTETNDLWVALGEASKQPIPKIMDGWIFKPGYPILSAKLDDKKRLTLSQKRFSYLPTSEENQRWQVPVQVKVMSAGSEEVRRVIIEGAEASIDLPQDFEAVLVNEGGHGFYRVGYSKELLERLITKSTQKKSQVTAIERLTLVNDAWATVLAGMMPLTEYLDLTKHFRNERDKNVWSVLISSFGLLNLLVSDEERPQLQALVRNRLESVVDELGWEVKDAESELIRQLRGDLLRSLGNLGNDKKVQERALETWSSFSNGSTHIDGNVLAASISIMAATGDASRYEDFLKRFRSASTPQEEQRFLFALASFRPAALVERTLDCAINGDVRTQDAPFLVRSLLSTVHGRQHAWKFVQAQWDKMVSIYPTQGLRRMCEGVTGLVSPEWEAQVQGFFERRQIKLGGKTLEQYLEQLRISVSLKSREGKHLSDYLK